MEPEISTLTLLRWQISRATAPVTRSSAGRFMYFRVCCTRSSASRLRNGDCPNSTAKAFFKVPSKTGSPVVLVKSASRISSLVVRARARWL